MDLIKLNISVPKKAAVIVMRELANDRLVLTRRSHTLRSHPGEICFPGGGWQEGDSSLYETALRELHEELGIVRSRLQLQKELAPEPTLTGYIIYPWYVLIESLLPYHCDEQEVAEVFTLPMRDVIDLTNYQEIMVNREGIAIKTYQYKASTKTVWGATARIMMQLADAASTV